MRIFFALVIAGCTSAPIGDAGLTDTGMPDAGPARPPDTVGPSERPARLYTPGAHDGTTPLPLVMLLHGYTVNAMLEDIYLGMTRRARIDGFYLLLPDGTIDADGEEHWDVVGREVDDHAYLRGLIEETQALVPVGEVYIVGHSNGAFMAFRLACDSADLVDAIASFAGSDVSMPCTSDVAVLQIHGTADDTILYDGGTIQGLVYPSAPDIVDTWAAHLGCTGSHAGAPLDLVATIDGAETTVLEHDGCAGAALWTMEGGGHIPQITDMFTPSIIAWLRATR